MIVVRGTTPTLTFTVPAMDLTQVNHIYVTFLSGDRELTKQDDNLDVVYTEDTVQVHLNQRDTLSFFPGLLRIKINVTYPSDRVTTEYAVARVYDNKPNRILK